MPAPMMPVALDARLGTEHRHRHQREDGAIREQSCSSGLPQLFRLPVRATITPARSPTVTLISTCKGVLSIVRMVMAPVRKNAIAAVKIARFERLPLSGLVEVIVIPYQAATYRSYLDASPANRHTGGDCNPVGHYAATHPLYRAGCFSLRVLVFEQIIAPIDRIPLTAETCGVVVGSCIVAGVCVGVLFLS